VFERMSGLYLRPGGVRAAGVVAAPLGFSQAQIQRSVAEGGGGLGAMSASRLPGWGGFMSPLRSASPEVLYW
jgi:hypothetical protein